VLSQSDLEKLGIERFTTPNVTGIKGSLRERYSDFIVNELHFREDILDLLNRFQAHGSPSIPKERTISCFQMKKRGIDTITAMNLIERLLNLRPNSISCAGMKDKQAVTSQLISFRSGSNLPLNTHYDFKKITLTYIGHLKKMIKIGDLLGNNFSITVRRIPLEDEETTRIVKQVHNEMRNFGGFMNYFGSQRFGDIRPNTHLIGKYILRNEIEEAINEYLLAIYPFENEDDKNARAKLAKNADYEEALKYFPKRLNFEKKIIQGLLKYDRDPEKAFLMLPKHLQTIFVFAFQSYIFNKILSRRNELGISFKRAILGDQVILLDALGLPSKVVFEVSKKNEEKLNSMIEKGTAAIGTPLVGYETKIKNEYVNQILDEEKVSPEDFRLERFPRLSSRGLLRPILCSPLSFEAGNVMDDELNSGLRKITLKFKLPKGSYATILLREFQKK